MNPQDDELIFADEISSPAEAPAAQESPKAGWKVLVFVYRIAWNEINTNEGKQMIKDKIELFLDFYEFITQRW